MMVEQSVQCQAPAKINMTLAVLGRRADGFHDIESWVVPIRLYDRLTITASERLSLTVHPDDAGVAADRSNLAWRAAEAIADESGRAPDVKIRLEKSIPAAAGLGGGSSDAAAVLRCLNELWGLGWSNHRLAKLAGRLGSDVPFFIEGRQAVIRGRGERVEPVESGWRGWVVLVIPPFGMSTRQVYENCSVGATSSPRVAFGPWAQAGSRTCAEGLFNDLEPAAMESEPRLADLWNTLRTLDGGPVRMSGSGSTLFTIHDSESAAAAWRDLAAGRIGTEAELKIVQTL